MACSVQVEGPAKVEFSVELECFVVVGCPADGSVEGFVVTGCLVFEGFAVVLYGIINA